MNRATGKICLALLLGLLIGHASVTVHTATHVTSDAAHCDLCNSYGNASEAMDSGANAEVPRFRAVHPPVPVLGHVTHRLVAHVRQRGPPRLN